MSLKVPKGTASFSPPDVGEIDATGHDLGNVKLLGDLGRILAGNSDDKPGLGKLSVGSLGSRGTATQPAGGDLTTDIKGSVGAINIVHNLQDATIRLDTAAAKMPNLGSLFVGGDFIGGATDTFGYVLLEGRINSVHIAGNVIGGTGAETGTIHAAGGIGSIIVDGKITGGAQVDAGVILAGSGTTSLVKLGGDLDGGTIEVQGKLGRATLKGSVLGGAFQQTGRFIVMGDAGRVSITQDIFGGAGSESGAVELEGNVQTLFVGGDVHGGAADKAGYVEIGKKLTGGTIVGDIQGGAGTLAGAVHLQDLGSLTVHGSVQGGASNSSGAIVVLGNAGSVTVLGDVVGGDSDNTGFVATGDTTLKIAIEGSMIGKGGQFSGSIQAQGIVQRLSVGLDLQGGSGQSSGLIYSKNGIGLLTIGRDIVGDTGPASGSILTSDNHFIAPVLGLIVHGGVRSGTGAGSGGIVVGGNILLLQIDKDVVGTDASPVFIDAYNIPAAKAKSNVAIKTVHIKGSVTDVQLGAGYHPGFYIEPDAQIGHVTIGGDFTRSSIVAGATDVSMDGYGNADDIVDPVATVAGFDHPDIHSAIASVVIKGGVFGSTDTTAHFGIEAESVGTLTIGKNQITLQDGPSNDRSHVIDTDTETNVTVNELLAPVPIM